MSLFSGSNMIDALMLVVGLMFCAGILDTAWRPQKKAFAIIAIALAIITAIAIKHRQRVFLGGPPQVSPIFVTVTILMIAAICALLVWFYLKTATMKAIRSNAKDALLFGGMVQLVLWEQNEGIIILRNMRISRTIHKSKGGSLYIYPFRGDSIGIRVPLTLRSLQWESSTLVTCESLQISFRGTIGWRVNDLPKYMYELESIRNMASLSRNVGPDESAELWFRALIESTLRPAVARTRVVDLITSQPGHYLSTVGTWQGVQDSEYRRPNTTPENIASELVGKLNAAVNNYGLVVERVEIQEAQLSQHIQDAINRAWSSWPDAQARKVQS